MVKTDFGEQPLKAQSPLGRGPALALILVDDENAVRRPTEFDGPVDESVLAVGGFPVLGDLLDRGLADVDDGQPVEMPGLDLGETRNSPAGADPLGWAVGSRVNWESWLTSRRSAVCRCRASNRPTRRASCCPLALGELVPEGRDQFGRALPDSTGGGDCSGCVSAHEGISWNVDRVAGTTETVPAVPQRRL